MKGSILVISGPSGSGKSSLMSKIIEEMEDVYFSISTTTREKREGEEEGKDYHFISKSDFKNEIKDGLFLEWANVHGYYYGTSLPPVIKALKDGKLVIFDIDVQGHKIAREKFDNITTSVFLTTPSMSTLKNRLEKRGSDPERMVDKRLKNALGEMTNIHEYDFLLINDDFEQSVDKMESIINVAKLKTSIFDIEQLIGNWVDS